MTTVRVPANIDISDRVLAGLTVRQLVILAPCGAVLVGLWKLLDLFMPTFAAIAVCAPVAAAAVVLVLGHRDGVSLDLLVWATIRHPRAKLAPGHVHAESTLLPPGARLEKIAKLRGPVRAISETGFVDLGAAGFAMALDATTVNFALRSEPEQQALVDGFARLLHAVPGAIQVVVATQPVDLSTHVARVREAAERLPHRAAARAGRDHAAWLDELAGHTELVRRTVTIVATAAAEATAERLGQIVVDGCARFGVTATRLTGPALAARIRGGIDPFTGAGC